MERGASDKGEFSKAVLIIAALVTLGVVIYVLVFWQPPPVEVIDWSVVDELR